MTRRPNCRVASENEAIDNQSFH